MAKGIVNSKRIENVVADGICHLSQGHRRDAGIHLFLDAMGLTQAVNGFPKDVWLRYVSEILEDNEKKRKRDLKAVFLVKSADQ